MKGNLIIKCLVLAISFLLLLSFPTFANCGWDPKNIRISDIRVTYQNLLTGESMEGIFEEYVVCHGEGFRFFLWGRNGSISDREIIPYDISIMIVLRYKGLRYKKRYIELTQEMGLKECHIPRALNNDTVVKFILKDETILYGHEIKGHCLPKWFTPFSAKPYFKPFLYKGNEEGIKFAKIIFHED